MASAADATGPFASELFVIVYPANVYDPLVGNVDGITPDELYVSDEYPYGVTLIFIWVPPLTALQLWLA
jgi:hypothetical protein